MFCNGEEYCVDGQCYSGNAVECGFAFVCDEESASCIRDCDSFHIDAYLECSSSFANVEESIDLINSELNIIDANISSFGMKIDDFDTRSTLNGDAIGGINTEIEDLKRKLNETEDKIARLGVNYPVPIAAQSGNNPFNFMNGNDNNNVVSMMDMLDIKDILIIGLLLINMIMAICNCIYKKNDKDSKGKYFKGVYQNIDVDDELSEEEILK